MAGPDSIGLPPDPRRTPILAGVFALGVSCLLTQLALMRELLGVFAGNELVLGVTLGNWLLLLGLGAALGRLVRADKQAKTERAPRVLLGLLLLTAVLPPLQ